MTLRRWLALLALALAFGAAIVRTPAPPVRAATPAPHRQLENGC